MYLFEPSHLIHFLNKMFSFSLMNVLSWIPLISIYSGDVNRNDAIVEENECPQIYASSFQSHVCYQPAHYRS
jgi:hypothetical protein